MSLRALLIGLVLLMPAAARADGCDALTARMIRATGASFAGRVGQLAVFRAQDAERMSLDCGSPRVMLFRADAREPQRPYFILIGMAARELTGARAEAVEDLAMRLHQATLLTGQTQQGRAGPALLRCEAGDRPDGFNDPALCRLAPVADPSRHRRGLSARRLKG